MAYRGRLRIVPADPTQPEWYLHDLWWWRFPELWDQYAFRDTGSPFHVDYEAEMPPAEALDWNERFTAAWAESSPETFDRCRTRVEEVRRQLEQAVQTARLIVIEWYEWESGLAD